MMTSVRNVYAIGDVAQFNGAVYGVVPAAIEQAKVAAANIAGEDSRYSGTVRLNTLKVAGLFLTSIGDIHAEDDAVTEYSGTQQGVYRKLVLRNGQLVGAIWFGETAKTKLLAQLIERAVPIEKCAEQIVRGELELSELLS